MRVSRPPAPPPAPPPQSRFGRYTLEDRIAVGGMAEVFRARETRDAGAPRTVVVKRMLPHLAVEPGARRMLEVEGRMGSCISHPNVVRVIDWGESEAQPFLVLEHVRGVDLWRLGRFLTRVGRTLEMELAVFVACELLAGLHAVHEAQDAQGEPLGLVHRDVSPSNVLVSLHGDVKLGDFGIARAMLTEAFPQAAVGERAKGKLGYLAPELVKGQRSDRRADVFAAAVITAELLMGRPLFAGGSELAVLLAIRDAEVRPFSDFAATLPEGLKEAVLGGLTRDPVERTATAAALRNELVRFIQSPSSVLRTTLAGIVAEAHGSRIPSGSMAAVDEETPMIATPLSAGEVTADIPSIQYWVVTADGTSRGPLPYAKLVEEVATRVISPEDRVGIGGQDMVAVRDHPELNRHLPASSLSERDDGASAIGHASEEHDMRGIGFVAGLASLVVREASGLLLCEQGGVRKELYLDGGVPEFVTSNLASELLGEFLVARSVISRGELDMALAVMPRFEGRLGDTLAALDLVEPVQLFRHIASQVEEKLLDLFTWTAGRAAFWPGVPKPQSGFPLGLDPWRILAEGVERRVGQDLDQDLLHPERRLAAIAGADLPLDAPLPKGARDMLAMLATPATVRSIVRARSALGETERVSKRNIVLLVALDALRVVAGSD